MKGDKCGHRDVEMEEEIDSDIEEGQRDKQESGKIDEDGRKGKWWEGQ